MGVCCTINWMWGDWVYVWIHMCMCAYIHVYEIYVYVVELVVCIWIHIYIYEYKCVCVHIYMCFTIFMLWSSWYVYEYTHIYIYEYIYMHMIFPQYLTAHTCAGSWCSHLKKKKLKKKKGWFWSIISHNYMHKIITKKVFWKGNKLVVPIFYVIVGFGRFFTWLFPTKNEE